MSLDPISVINPDLLWRPDTARRAPQRSPWLWLSLLIAAGLLCWLAGERCERRAPVPAAVAGILWRPRRRSGSGAKDGDTALHSLIASALARVVFYPRMRDLLQATCAERDRLRRELAEAERDVSEAEAEIRAAEAVLDRGGVPARPTAQTLAERCAQLVRERDAAQAPSGDEAARWYRQILTCSEKLLEGREGRVQVLIAPLADGEDPAEEGSAAAVAIGEVRIEDDPPKVVD